MGWAAALLVSTLGGVRFELDRGGITVPSTRIVQLLGMAGLIFAVCLALQYGAAD